MEKKKLISEKGMFAYRFMRCLILTIIGAIVIISRVEVAKADASSRAAIITGMEESKNSVQYHVEWFMKNQLYKNKTYYPVQYVVPNDGLAIIGGVTIEHLEFELDMAFGNMTSEDTGYLIYCGHGNNLPPGILVRQPFTTYSYSDLLKRICTYKFNKMFIILDCCYAGSIIKAYRDLPEVYKNKISIIYAAQSNEEAFMLNWLKMGLFSEVIVCGLYDQLADTNPKDGKITVKELGDYAVSNIGAYFQKHINEGLIPKNNKVHTPGYITTNPNEVIYATTDSSSFIAIPDKTILRKGVEKGEGKVYIEWDKKNVDGYQVRWSLNKNMVNYKTASTKNSFMYRRGLIGGKTYYFQVRSYKMINQKKKYSNWSKEKKIELKTLPPKTTISSIVANSNSKFTVRWNVLPNVKGYQIRYSRDSLFNNKKTASTNKNYISRSGLLEGVYFVGVRTYNISMDGTRYYSNWSTTKKVTLKKSNTGNMTYPRGRWVINGNSQSIEVEFSSGYVNYYQYDYNDFNHTKVISSWRHTIKNISKKGNIYTIMVYANDGTIYTYKTNPNDYNEMWYYSSYGTYSANSSICKKDS